MAGDFDYGSFWENARDALDVLDNLGNAMHQFLAIRGPYYEPGTPPGFRLGKCPKPADYAERRRKAIDVLRKAGQDFVARLAEDRFVEPLANVWPPSAPRKLTSRFSYAIRSAPSGYFDAGEYDGKDLDHVKRSLFSARDGVQAVVRELEQRPDLAERAYQRARSKLPRRSRGQSGSGGTTTVEIVAPVVKSQAAHATHVPKNTGGRPREWEDLWAVIQEKDRQVPKLTGKAIAAAYNRKYGSQLGDGAGKRKRASAKIVTRVRYERTKRINRKQDPK